MCFVAHRKKDGVYAKTGERVLVTSRGCSRQKLHNDFKKASWVGEKETSRRDSENENQTQGHFAMIRAGTKMRLWIAEESYGRVRAAPLSRVKKLVYVSIV